uniref:NADH dehydrogenase subunit 6 n=1 Tax=Eurylepta cornuta TaxID=1879303 RepID=A0A2R3SK55_9PLAT|nr:NADH dehydrogenase subunit 6 [Eurylepta cornuta]
MVSWGLLLGINYLCMYANNTLKLGGMILILSINISVIVSLNYLSWLSLIFFIIYIGGLLVLFFYLSSLNYNPIFSLSKLSLTSSMLVKINSGLVILLGSLSYTFSEGSFSFITSNFNNFSNSLFNEEEFNSLILVGVMLLLVLWLVTKLTYNTRGALRPTF